MENFVDSNLFKLLSLLIPLGILIVAIWNSCKKKRRSNSANVSNSKRTKILQSDSNSEAIVDESSDTEIIQ